MISKTIIIYEGSDIKSLCSAVSEQLPDGYSTDDLIKRFDPSFFSFKSGEPKALRFVGSFSIEYDNCIFDIYCFPKYMAERSAVDISEMQPIIKAIELAGLTPITPDNAKFDPSEKNTYTSRMLQTELAQWIVNDYLQNGIINIKSRQISLKQRGFTNWGKTVSKLIPVTDGENFVYPHQYHTYYETDNELLISKLHSCAVAEALNVLKASGNRTIPAPEHDHSLLGKLSEYSPFIQKMLSRLYEDRQIHTLRAMLAWCSLYSIFYKQPIGTVSFELVWERCLRIVFDNVSERIEGDFVFENPVYHIDNNDYTLNHSQGIPDIVNINNDTKEFMLLDAKYYLGKIDKKSNTISSVPMYKDISKQMYYFDMLCDYGLAPEKGVNAFVMPVHGLYGNEVRLKDGEWFRYIGYVDYSDDKNNVLIKKFGLSKQSKKNKNKEHIMLIQIDPQYLFRLAASKNPDENRKHTDLLRSALNEHIQSNHRRDLCYDGLNGELIFVYAKQSEGN